MGRHKLKKEIYFPFTYTTLTKEELFDNYKSEDYDNFKLNNIIKYLTLLEEYDRIIFLLYCEYNNYSLVAEETNTTRICVYNSIKKIKKKMKKIIKER